MQRMATQIHAQRGAIQPLSVGVDEAASLLGVSRRHLYKLLETGALKSLKSGKRRLFRVAELERYAKESEAQ